MEGIVDFTARDQLLRTVLGRVIRGRLRRICNLTGTNSSAPSIFVGQFFFISCVSFTISIFQLTADIGCIDVGLHACQFLQLCDVDGIGVVCTGGYAVDLAGYCAIRSTNGYGTSSCIPGMGSLICRLSLCCGIIATYLFSRSNSYFRPAADGYAALGADFCVVADGYDVGGRRFIVGSIGRTDDDVVLLIRQFVVVTEDDIGLILVYAVSADRVVRTNDIVMFAVSQFVLESIDEVVLRRRAFCIGAVCARDGVANADDLAHIGTFDVIAAAHDHDLGTTLRNSRL